METVDPIEVHRTNTASLSEHDILIPAYPGSGHALLGNILLELGLDYFDPYTEQQASTGKIIPIPARVAYRTRLAASMRRDRDADHRASGGSKWRFVKTHAYPDEFSSCKTGGTVLLVRDPRDAIYSYYQWRRGFSEEGESGSFLDFLLRTGLRGKSPCADWAAFHLEWFRRVAVEPRAVVLRFEALKQDGEREMRKLLDLYAPEVSHAMLMAALQASTFDAMRAHEDGVVEANNPYRIMRRGLVAGWTEWYGCAHRSFFGARDIVTAARIADYDLANKGNGKRRS